MINESWWMSLKPSAEEEEEEEEGRTSNKLMQQNSFSQAGASLAIPRIGDNVGRGEGGGLYKQNTVKCMYAIIRSCSRI